MPIRWSGSGTGGALRRDAGTVAVGILTAFAMVHTVRSGDVEGFRLFDAMAIEPYPPGEEPTLGEIYGDMFETMFPNSTQFVITVLNWLWSAIEILTMLSNPRRRALHDYIGGTVVIHDPKPRPLRTTPPPPGPMASDDSNHSIPPSEPSPVPKNPPQPPRGLGW